VGVAARGERAGSGTGVRAAARGGDVGGAMDVGARRAWGQQWRSLHDG
jgi:hypothetical protein